jgi:hypothetical protein
MIVNCTFNVKKHCYRYNKGIEEDYCYPSHGSNEITNHKQPDHWQENREDSTTNDKHRPGLPNVCNVSLQPKDKAISYIHQVASQIPLNTTKYLSILRRFSLKMAPKYQLYFLFTIFIHVIIISLFFKEEYYMHSLKQIQHKPFVTCCHYKNRNSFVRVKRTTWAKPQRDDARKSTNLHYSRSWINGLVDCFINENIFIDANTTQLLPVLQRDIGCPCNKLAAPIDWKERLIWIAYYLSMCLLNE